MVSRHAGSDIRRQPLRRGVHVSGRASSKGATTTVHKRYLVIVMVTKRAKGLRLSFNPPSGDESPSYDALSPTEIGELDAHLRADVCVA